MRVSTAKSQVRRPRALATSMPAFLERKLKKEYGQDSSIPYRIMKSIGAMKGDKETRLGKKMEKKHEMAKKMRRMKIHEK